MKKIYSAPEISEILVEEPTCIITTSEVPKINTDGEAKDDPDATLSKKAYFPDEDSEW